jgi:hypothetical protein
VSPEAAAATAALMVAYLAVAHDVPAPVLVAVGDA